MHCGHVQAAARDRPGDHRQRARAGARQALHRGQRQRGAHVVAQHLCKARFRDRPQQPAQRLRAACGGSARGGLGRCRGRGRCKVSAQARPSGTQERPSPSRAMCGTLRQLPGTAGLGGRHSRSRGGQGEGPLGGTGRLLRRGEMRKQRRSAGAGPAFMLYTGLKRRSASCWSRIEQNCARRDQPT